MQTQKKIRHAGVQKTRRIGRSYACVLANSVVQVLPVPTTWSTGLFEGKSEGSHTRRVLTLRSISKVNSKELSSLLGLLIDGKQATISATCLARDPSASDLLFPQRKDMETADCAQQTSGLCRPSPPLKIYCVL